MKTPIRLILAAVTAGALTTPSVLADLIHHWTFEGSTSDSGSGGKPVSLLSNASLNSFCSPTGEGSLLLDAAAAPSTDGGAITAATVNWGAFANGDVRTVAFWMKGPSVGQEVNGTMFGAGTSVTGGRFDVKISGNFFRVEIQGVGQTTTTRVITDRWHHVAVVCPNTASTMANILFYIDGVQVTNGSTSAAAVNTTTAPIRLGDSSITGTDRDFDGYLDDVRVYDNALSLTEIKALFDAGRLVRCFAPDQSEVVIGNSTQLSWEGAHLRTGVGVGTADDFALGSNMIGASGFDFGLLTTGPDYYLRANGGTYLGQLYKVTAFDGTAKTFTLENGDDLAADGDATNWGGSFDLYSYALNYETLVITDDQGGSPVDAALLSNAGLGTLSISPTVTTTYTLTATANGGASVDSRQVTVIVKSSPDINTFVAAPSLIYGVGSPTLSWTTESAKRLEISDGTSVIATYTTTADTQGVLDSGSFTAAAIDATTTYTITGWLNEAGTGATTVVQAIATVQPAPDFTLHASKPFISSGTPITLHWNATVLQTEVVPGTSVFEVFPTVQGNPLIDNDIDFDSVLSSGTSYIMEVTNGDIVGSTTTVTGWTGNSLSVADNFVSDASWSSYRIYSATGTDMIVINDGSSDIATITDPAEIASGSLVLDPGPASTTTYTGTASIAGATANAMDTAVVTVGGAGTSYPELILASGPVGYFRFEENSGTTVVYDSSGNGNHSTSIIGNLTSGGLGALGKAGGFNGNETVTTGVTLNPQDPDDDDLAGDDDPDDIEGWTLEVLYRNDVPVNGVSNRQILSNGDGAGVGRSMMYLDSQGNLVSFSGGTTQPNSLATLDSRVASQVSDWHHAAISCTGNPDGTYTLRFYDDGVMVAEQLQSTGLGVPTAPEAADGAWVIGSHKARQLGVFWRGLLDEVAIYPRTLSDAEIAGHYGAFLAQSTGPLAFGGSKRIVAGDTGELTYKVGGASSSATISGVGSVSPGVASSISIAPLVDTTYILNVAGQEVSYTVTVIDPFFVTDFGIDNGAGVPFLEAGGLTEGINYELFTSPDLQIWTGTGVIIQGTASGTATFEDSMAFDPLVDPKRFYQVRDVD